MFYLNFLNHYLQLGIQSKFFRYFIFVLIVFIPFFGWVINRQSLPEQSKQYNLEAKLEITEDGSSRLYVIVDGVKHDLSLPEKKYLATYSRGNYIVWIEQDSSGNQSLMLKEWPSSTNVEVRTGKFISNPKVNSVGVVVWQEWGENEWQIWYRVSSPMRALVESGINPDINDDNLLVFARKNSQGQWQAETYEPNTHTKKIVQRGVLSKYPAYDNNQLVFSIPK